MVGGYRSLIWGYAPVDHLIHERVMLRFDRQSDASAAGYLAIILDMHRRP